jgi:hypothetical protein
VEILDPLMTGLKKCSTKNEEFRWLSIGLRLYLVSRYQSNPVLDSSGGGLTRGSEDDSVQWPI